MIFTGYDFPNAEAILPFLEEPETGQTSQFCKALASRLRCYVAAGYPERLSDEEKAEPPAVGANSAILYSPDGSCVGGYRKVNMFETDKTWAKPGPSFKSFSLPMPIGTLSLGICMDLNPHTALWSTEKGPFELAEYCLSTESKPRTNVLLLLNAWLDSKEDLGERWDWQTLNYWLSRLRPLWKKEVDPHDESNSDSDDSDDGETPAHQSNNEDRSKQTIVVICNRCGDDKGTQFAGSSAVLKLEEGSGSPNVVGVMNRHQEGVRIWTIE